MKTLIFSALIVLSATAMADAKPQPPPETSSNYLVVVTPRQGSNLSGRNSVTVHEVTRITHYYPDWHGLIQSLELESPILIDGKPTKFVSIEQLNKISSGGGAVVQVPKAQVGPFISFVNRNTIVEMSDDDFKLLQDEAVATGDFSHYKSIVKGFTDRPNWQSTDMVARLQTALNNLKGIKGAEGTRYLMSDKLESATKGTAADGLSIEKSVIPDLERSTIDR